MNEKTARQIEEMKKQTIGVEVEMNSMPPRLPQSFSEREDTRTQHSATDTAPGRHGTQTAESGNSRRT